MSKLVSDLELLGAKIEELAKAAGRKVEEVYEEIVAHIDGKTAEAASAPKASPQPGDLAGTIGSVTAAEPPTASASASASTETASPATDTAASTETAPAATTEAPAGEPETASTSAASTGTSSQFST